MAVMPPLRVGAAPAPDTGLAAVALAKGEHVCGMAFGQLVAGVAQPPQSASGCGLATDSDAIYQAASLSKPVFAYLVLKLVANQALALDTPVARYLPQGYVHRQNLFALHQTPVQDIFPTAQLQKISVRMLLTHSSGLPNWSSNGPLVPAFAPGSSWQYSGEGYVLLQRVVEAVTGAALEQLAEQLVFAPLGMRHSAFYLTDAVSVRLVPGQPSAGKARQLRFPFAIASSSLYTSASDYLAFMAAILEEGGMASRIVEQAVPVPRSAGLLWGLGWGIEQSAAGTYLWHWGNNPGYRALVMLSLTSRDGVVVFTNSDEGMPVAKALIQAALPGAHEALRFGLVE